MRVPNHFQNQSNVIFILWVLELHSVALTRLKRKIGIFFPSIDCNLDLDIFTRKNNTKSHRSGEGKLIEKMAKNIIRKRNGKEGDSPMSVSTSVDFVFSSENHVPCSPNDYLENCSGQTFKRDCPSVYPPIRLSVCPSVGSSVRPTVRPKVRFGSSIFRSFSCPKMSKAKNNEKQNKLKEAIRETSSYTRKHSRV